MWTSIIIAQEEEADINKVIKMALVHDITETRTTDTNYVSRMYVKRDDDAAIKDTFENISIEKEFLEIFKEYEERKTLEAKIVKDADNLDCDLELEEQYVGGIKLKDDLFEVRNRVYELLFTKTAKEMFKEIKKSNPNDWHSNGKNRINNGDWKK